MQKLEIFSKFLCGVKLFPYYDISMVSIICCTKSTLKCKLLRDLIYYGGPLSGECPKRTSNSKAHG